MDIFSRNPRDALTIDIARVATASVLTVSGEIDVHTAPRLRAELGEIFVEAPGGPVFLDLTAVTFVSSAGLAVLVDAHADAQQRSRPFGLVVDHFAGATIRSLQTANLTDMFATYSDVAEAIAHSG